MEKPELQSENIEDRLEAWRAIARYLKSRRADLNNHLKQLEQHRAGPLDPIPEQVQELTEAAELAGAFRELDILENFFKRQPGKVDN